MNIIVNKENKNKRLDTFLVKKMPDLSRSKIQKMIKAGLVLVNNKQSTKHQFLKEGDVINFSFLVIPTEAAGRVEGSLKKERDSSTTFRSGRNDNTLWQKVKIIADTPDYLIIDKPSGLLIHPTVKGESDTLIDWAAEKYPEIAKIGDEPGRAGIVHRLDKEVSGLMVIPKTQAAFEYFKKLFKTRQIEKKYTALVYGEIKGDTGEIDFPITRSKTKSGLYGALPSGSIEGRPAKTVFHVIKRFKNYTLLEVQILTGRTHQIRVHLLAFGHPIVGDLLYKNKRFKEQKINRIFLHASYLGFDDLSGKYQGYQSSLPKKIVEFLNKLK
jgi:23S rRNA pseudouridine1911/1915/1917 synthase